MLVEYTMLIGSFVLLAILIGLPAHIFFSAMKGLDAGNASLDNAIAAIKRGARN